MNSVGRGHGSPCCGGGGGAHRKLLGAEDGAMNHIGRFRVNEGHAARGKAGEEGVKGGGSGRGQRLLQDRRGGGLIGQGPQRAGGVIVGDGRDELDLEEVGGEEEKR